RRRRQWTAGHTTPPWARPPAALAAGRATLRGLLRLRLSPLAGACRRDLADGRQFAVVELEAHGHLTAAGRAGRVAALVQRVAERDFRVALGDHLDGRARFLGVRADVAVVHEEERQLTGAVLGARARAHEHPQGLAGVVFGGVVGGVAAGAHQRRRGARAFGLGALLGEFRLGRRARRGRRGAAARGRLGGRALGGRGGRPGGGGRGLAAGRARLRGYRRGRRDG